jgi:acetylornithine deacetylase
MKNNVPKDRSVGTKSKQLTAYSLETQTESAIELLKRLIATPSLSREEDRTAQVIEQFFRQRSIPYRRTKNNVWTHNRFFDPEKPTILLNSHHDTVKPNASWTLDPFKPLERDGKLYGLGSNDAGGCLVSLIGTFCHFYDKKDLAYNIVMAATAEEEISGREGLEMILPELPPIDFAIVGEPTQMHLAVAEKGLLVLDCTARGKSGHAARDEGDNAIYRAIKDIEWLTSSPFPKVSPTLGPVKLSVTVINAGSQHNVVPDSCTFTVDVRATEQYTLNRSAALDSAKTVEYSARSPDCAGRYCPETRNVRFTNYFRPGFARLSVVEMRPRPLRTVAHRRRIYLFAGN